MSFFRVDGLASGLNTSDIIEQMMSLERRPITVLQQRQSAIEQRKSAWNDVQTRLQNLQSTAQALLQRTSLFANTVHYSGANAPVSVSAGSSAIPGSYSISISQLATSTLARSSGPIAGEIVRSDRLDELNLGTMVTSGTFSINGVTINVDAATDSLDDVIARINGSAAGVTASLVQVNGRDRLALAANSPAGPLQLGSAGDTANFLSATHLLAAPRSADSITGTAALASVQLAAALEDANLAMPVTGAGTLTINNVEIAYDADADSLSTIISRINGSNAGVTASYDAAMDRFSLRNKQTGSITIALSDTGTLLAGLGIADPGTQTLGQNAIYSLDGGVTNRYSTSNTVTDAIGGLSITLTATTTSPFEFTISQDIDSAVNVIKQFVDQYNSTMSFLREKSSYNSDTKTAGILQGDNTIRNLQRSIRQMVTSLAVGTDGAFNSLSQIGISFGSVGSAIGSTNDLKLDTAKLRSALQTNAQAVFGLFASTSSASLSTAGDIASIVGSPTAVRTSGRYEITSDGTGTMTASFIDATNATLSTASGTIAAGTFNTSLIAGLTLKANDPLTGATSTIEVTYRQGVMVALDQYLSDALGVDGAISIRSSTADTEIRQLGESIRKLEVRLDDKEQRLIRQFANLERMLAQMQAQSNALAGQIAGLLGQE